MKKTLIFLALIFVAFPAFATTTIPLARTGTTTSLLYPNDWFALTGPLSSNGSLGAIGNILESLGSGSFPTWVATNTLGFQPTGNYITSLTGDGTASGPGAAGLTLATVNTNIGTFQGLTVNGKGLVTAASNQNYLTTAVTSVGASTPTGLTVSGSPITTTGTLAFSLTSGYTIPLIASTTQWASAYASTTALSGTSPVVYAPSTGVISCPTCNVTASNVTSVSNSDGTLTISPTTGLAVASIALGHANTWTATQTFNNSTYQALFSGTGNVGIGTTTPNYQLVVKGSGTGNVALGNLAGAGTYGALSVEGDLSTNCYNLTSSPSDQNLYINRCLNQSIQFKENNGAAQMTLASGGGLTIAGTSGSANNLLSVASSTGSTTYQVNSKGHVVTGGAAPTVSGGTSSIVSPSNDTDGQISVAGTALTSVTLTFAKAYTIAPICTESDNQLVVASDITSISTTQVVFGFGTGGVTTATIWYHCDGTQ